MQANFTMFKLYSTTNNMYLCQNIVEYDMPFLRFCLRCKVHFSNINILMNWTSLVFKIAQKSNKMGYLDHSEEIRYQIES